MVKAPQVDSYIRMTLPIASKLFSGPHPLNPSTLFSSLPLSPPDLYLVSSEGFYLPTLRLLLTNTNLIGILFCEERPDYN